MSPRVAPLWGAFLVAHVLAAVLGWVLPGQPMGDVVLVYQPWSQAALSGQVVGITEDWVYPQLALVPMLIAQTVAAPLVPALGVYGAYLVAWAVLVTIADLAAFSVLLGRGRMPARRRAGWFWTAAVVLLGPIALYRIDAVTVPVAVVGGLWLVRRPGIAGALLALGAWMKIWPGALVLAALALGRRAGRVVAAAALVTAVVLVVLLVLGGGEHLFGFLHAQTGRGLQIEAVAATGFLWAAVLGGPASVVYSREILTFQIHAPGADAVAALLTPLMVLAVGGILALGLHRSARGAHPTRVLPPLALALVSVLIVTNKVGSPQFQTWLLAPIVLWIVLDRERSRIPAALVLTCCALTFAIYPVTYDALLTGHPLPVALLTARDAVLIALLVHTVRALRHAPSRPAHAWRIHARRLLRRPVRNRP